MSRHPWFDNLPAAAVIAHRGASLDAPENTLAAFERAVELGADAIELDVMLCGSGEPVVIHDAEVDRTTDGSGAVRNLSLSALKELDAGSWFDSEYAGEQVPTLEEVLRGVGRDIRINVELKNYRTPLDSLPKAVAEVVRRCRMTGRVWFSSFNPVSLRRIRRLVPESPAGLLLARGGERAFIRAAAGLISGYDAVHPEFSDLDEAYIGRLHLQSKPVFPYTANQPEDIRRMAALGADGIITDDPALALRIIRSLADVDELAEN